MIRFARITMALSLATLALASTLTAGNGVTLDRPVLSLAAARTIIAAAEAAAAARGVGVVTVVVDSSGTVIELSRMDTAQVASVNVGIGKARTAAIYRRPSRDFEEQASGGRPSALHLARAVPLQGGMPILHDGEVVGAIGVSGARSADEDQELAVIGAGSAEPVAAGS